MKATWILTIVACFLYFEPSIAELKLLQAVFRHGNRTPTMDQTFYPNDPYGNMTYEPEGHGGLTNTGKMTAYKLGQFLRLRYEKLLGPIYSKEIIWFRADEVERVVMTGELVAAGLFPPVKRQRWNPALRWQPIPIWALPHMDDDYLYNGMDCSNAKKWTAEVDTTNSSVVKFNLDNKETFDYLTENAGALIQEPIAGFALRQILYAQKDIGLKLPAWTKKVFPHGKLDEIAGYALSIQSGTQELKQLLGGIWIREWLDHVDNYLNNSDKRKAFMYAAHEINIAPIVIALNNYDNQVPTYCSTVMFELHEMKSQYYVQVHYRNNGKMRTLKIPGCGINLCPLDTFKSFVDPVIPKDVVSLCGKLDL
ncbi:venom acid phosphatase Acph-1-like [Colletes gigas]|uniref:venom acid phosphatase Acph-1-like n=1 Tax=Colletes gigas TaxID=935657 RepID=UPI001C9B2BD0|nr:venom acid phosphatase Acph-1-like [Colletes gigas]